MLGNVLTMVLFQEKLYIKDAIVLHFSYLLHNINYLKHPVNFTIAKVVIQVADHSLLLSNK